MKSKYYPLVLLFLAMTYSCSQDVSPEVEIAHELAGTWKDTLLNTDGSSIHLEMIFETDSSFVQLISLYGIYDGQDDSDLSAWFKLEGRIEINQSSLNFIVDRYTWLDQQYSSEIVEEVYFGVLYNNCSYTLSNDRNTLQLSYMAPPAISTVIELNRAN